MRYTNTPSQRKQNKTEKEGETGKSCREEHEAEGNRDLTERREDRWRNCDLSCHNSTLRGN